MTTNMISKHTFITLVASVFAMGMYAFAAEPSTQPSTQPSAKQTKCVVSDEELGSMGDPVVLTHEGREVKLCCSGCTKRFQKDPAKYIKKLDEQAAATTQPAK